MSQLLRSGIDQPTPKGRNGAQPAPLWRIVYYLDLLRLTLRYVYTIAGGVRRQSELEQPQISSQHYPFQTEGHLRPQLRRVMHFLFQTLSLWQKGAKDDPKGQKLRTVA